MSPAVKSEPEEKESVTSKEEGAVGEDERVM